jgi:alpha-tubulin suppressor-like RCC1 family protein
LTPTVEVLSGATAIAVGGFHTCAILNSKKVRCWGQNFYGELGDGTTTDRAAPGTDIPDLEDARHLSAGDYHTCVVLGSGNVRCWGWNFSGQLGDGTNMDRSSTGSDIVGLTGAVAVRAGKWHTCAVLGDGTSRCWGSNAYGQLGDNTKTSRSTVGVDISGLNGVVDMAAGHFHTCALVRAGGVRCWGENGAGALGDGTTISRQRPIELDIPGLSDVVAVGANGHSCANLASGQLRCWGDNGNGQLGDGTTMNRLSPVDVPLKCQ